MKSGKQPVFTRKFIMAIAVIYSLLVIGIAVLFSYTVGENSRIVESTLLEESNEVLLGATTVLTEQILLREQDTVKKIKPVIQEVCGKNRHILHVLLFGRTGDENYFRLVETVPVRGHIVPEIRPGDVVQETSGIDYFKEGQIHPVIDPRVYTRGDISWQHTYHPLTIKNKKYILQYMVSSEQKVRITASFSAANTRSFRFLAIMTGVLVVAVIILTIIFFQNYTYLVKRLTERMQMAAGGNLDIGLNPTGDSELSELAQSFNTLIEEMRDMKARKDSMEKEKTETDSEDQTVKSIFNQGVACLKENRHDDAIALFKTLLLTRSGSFGCYFNLGVAYAKTRRYDESMDMFMKAKESNPSYTMTDSYIERVGKILAANAATREH